MKTKIVSIVGPTAAGKTALAVEIAEKLNTEIISCDSMQIYKYLDIGTAKPTVEEREKAKHHLIDFVDPRETYSVASYVEDAKNVLSCFGQKGMIPVFCGGTGLYIDSLTKGTGFSEAGSDESYREELKKIAEEKGNAYLFSLLQKIDPESAEKTHANNVKRVIRALEIYKLTGRTKSYWDALSRTSDCPYDEIRILVDYKNREKLYGRIDKRVQIMIDKGLVDEVRSLYGSGVLVKGTTAAQAIGYKELIEYLDGKVPFETAVENVRQNTRNYAKRQLTWFRAQPGIVWLDGGADDLFTRAETAVSAWLSDK